jgi:hypothetical protein
MKKVLINTENGIEAYDLDKYELIISTEFTAKEKEEILKFYKNLTINELIEYIENNTICKSLQSLGINSDTKNKIESIRFIEYHREVYKINENEFILLNINTNTFVLANKTNVIDYVRTFLTDEQVIELLKLECK